LADAAGQMARLFDIRYGGFGTAPKFPHPAGNDFLLARWHDTREGWMREVVEKSLTGMAKGGIRDHLGGGFHRYAVDERWIVLHFEKMAYDNSELLRSYLNAYAAFGTPLFADVAQGIVTWVLETLSDTAHGAFYTSQDADVEFGDDGDYWTWTPRELHEALNDETAYHVIRRVYDVAIPGEMQHDHEKNVLWWKEDPADETEWRLLKESVAQLKAARGRRKAPYVDTTAYVNWNAMMAAAFLHAGAVLDRPECNTLALKVLSRIWAEAWDDARGIAHVIGRTEPHGLLDDNIQAAAAFLDAYEATGEDAWLTRALAVVRHCVRVHWDETDGGFSDLARDRAGAAYLATPAKPIQDAPTPSANGVAALVLARAAAITDHPEWRRLLDRQLATFAGAAAQLSLYGATLLRAVDWALNPVTRIEVAGPPDEVPDTVANFVKLANSGFYDGTKFHRVIPNFMIQGGDPYSKTGKGRVGTGGPGYTIKCETHKNVHKHVAGTLSMAHAGKDTGGSQFFICHSPQPHLDGVHTVFGQVTKGLDVVNKIAQNDEVQSIRVK